MVKFFSVMGKHKHRRRNSPDYRTQYSSRYDVDNLGFGHVLVNRSCDRLSPVRAREDRHRHRDRQREDFSNHSTSRSRSRVRDRLGFHYRSPSPFHHSTRDPSPKLSEAQSLRESSTVGNHKTKFIVNLDNQSAQDMENRNVDSDESTGRDQEEDNSVANTIKKGWRVISEVLSEDRLISADARSDKVRNVPIPGRVEEQKKTSKPASKQLQDTFSNFSEALPNTLTNGLINSSSLECNAQWYRPDNPVWKPYSSKQQKFPLGLENPSNWSFNMTNTKMGDVENLTANLLNVSSYVNLLSESQGQIMRDKEVLSVKDIENLCDTQEAIAAATRDMLSINTALAVNCTLLRRDAVLENSKSRSLNLQERTKIEARVSSLDGRQLFGPEADKALKAQNENPAIAIKQTIKTLHNQSFRKSEQSKKKFANWSKSQLSHRGGYPKESRSKPFQSRGGQKSGSRSAPTSTVTSMSKQ